MPVMNSAQHLLARETITPGLDPPPGVTPNFVDPETRAPYAIIAHTIALSLATIFVAMRMYTKIWITRSPGWDDCEFFPVVGVAHCQAFFPAADDGWDRYQFILLGRRP